MTLFNRHERCIGLKLWKSKTRFVQLWYCPRGYEVKPHGHFKQTIELMYILGKTEFFRIANNPFSERLQSFKPKWYHMFRKFTVSAGQIHWFKVSNFPLLFINFSTAIDGYKTQSAAIDFVETKDLSY